MIFYSAHVLMFGVWLKIAVILHILSVRASNFYSLSVEHGKLARVSATLIPSQHTISGHLNGVSLAGDGEPLLDVFSVHCMP